MSVHPGTRGRGCNDARRYPGIIFFRTLHRRTIAGSILMDSVSIVIFEYGYSSGIDMGCKILVATVILSLVIMFGRLAERA